MDRSMLLAVSVPTLLLIVVLVFVIVRARRGDVL